MNNLNWGLYNENDQTNTKLDKEPISKSELNWDLYKEPSTTSDTEKSVEESSKKDKFYQEYFKDVINKTPEDLKKMSVGERMYHAQALEAEQLYRKRGDVKGLISELTLGGSELIPGLDVKPHELSGTGRVLSNIVPYVAAERLINYGLKGINALKNLGEGAQFALNVGKTAATGVTVEAGKQGVKAAKGEGFDIEKVAQEGAIFGALGAALPAIFQAGKAGYEWLKSLNVGQRATVLTQGKIPTDLSPTSYKFYQNEVVPELQKIAGEEYAAASEEATKIAETEYQQELANTRAKHERELQEIALKKNASQEEIKAAEELHENKMKQLAAEHEQELQSIEEANQQAAKEFEEANELFENAKRTQNVVEDAINAEPPKSPEESLKGRISPSENILPENLSPKLRAREALKDKVGKVITPEKIQNTYDAGFKNIQAVKATDKADRQKVNKLYSHSDELNSRIDAEQPELASQLHNIIEDLSKIPEPSPAQKQLLNSAKETLNTLLVFDEEGVASGFKAVNNQDLLEQAKALRYFMDYTYAHGDPRGIFTPMVDALQDAVESAAILQGIPEAAQANQAARSAYRDWVKLYENPFIKKLRNETNHQFSKSFEGSLNVDDFLQLDKVLSKTNAGQQLSKQTKRALIDKELNKFYRNPKLSRTEEFTETLKELEPILNPGEGTAIRREFDQTLKEQALNFKAKGAPTKPTPKEITSVRIPQYKKPISNIKEPTHVNLPRRKPLRATQAMKVAGKKMKITPEQIISKTETPTGWNEIKTDLQKTSNGEKIFEEIGKEKIADMLYGGKVRGRATGLEKANRLREGNNFNILSEIMGEAEALDLLKALEAIGETEVTIKNLKKFVRKGATLKAAAVFGIL